MEYGSAPSNITSNFYSTAANRGVIYRPNAGYGAAADPSKNDLARYMKMDQRLGRIRRCLLGWPLQQTTARIAEARLMPVR